VETILVSKQAAYTPKIPHTFFGWAIP
jgi:hypothetical protein